MFGPVNNMANTFIVALGVLLIFESINGLTANRCTRSEHAKKSTRLNGDGGYRIFIDGEPTRYQPGKIYNGIISMQLFILFQTEFK